jgi:hypothetical protein
MEISFLPICPIARRSGCISLRQKGFAVKKIRNADKSGKKILTREAGTLNMAVAPAAAFPPNVVPFIRMPE